MYTTPAFTLAKKNIGEDDREYCFFTKKFGKISMIAKGIRKPSAKLSGQLEPPRLINISFVSANNKKITGAIVKNSFSNIASDVQKEAIALYILSLINQFIIGETQDLKLWNLLKETMEFIDKAEDNNSVNFAKLYFITKFVQNAGFEPNLTECTSCGVVNVLGPKIVFDFDKNGIICRNCQDQLKTNNFMNLNLQTLKSLQLLFGKNLDYLIKNELDLPILNQKKALNQFFQTYLKTLKNIY